MIVVKLCCETKLFGKASTGKPAVKWNVRFIGDELPILPWPCRQSYCFRLTSAPIAAFFLAGTIFGPEDYFPATGRSVMARKYSKKAAAKVERAMKERNAGTLKSGRSGRKVTSRKQAIAIGLSEARAAGAKVPKKTAKKTKAKR
jgi:hypothetical protein